MLFRISVLSIFLVLAGCSDTLDNNKVTAPIADTEPSAPVINEMSDPKRFTCPHQESREALFTSREAKDKLDIQIIGEDCDAARILMRILTPTGEVVHETEARALDYTYDDFGAGGVQRMLESLISSQYYENALEDLSKLTENNGYYNLNRDAATRAAKANLPLFCHRAGKSFANCYAFIDGRSVFIFSTGS